jgi:uncharacterized protein (DUF1778 family)
MHTKQAEKARTRPVNLKVRDEVISMIDRAARIRGKNRSEFMIEASLAAAQETVFDQRLVRVDAESYRHYLNVLDRPPSSAGFARLTKVTKPW